MRGPKNIACGSLLPSVIPPFFQPFIPLMMQPRYKSVNDRSKKYRLWIIIAIGYSPFFPTFYSAYDAGTL